MASGATEATGYTTGCPVAQPASGCITGQVEHPYETVYIIPISSRDILYDNIDIIIVLHLYIILLVAIPGYVVYKWRQALLTKRNRRKVSAHS